MSSVFRKLITKELGANRYNNYFFCYQKLIIEKKYDSTNLSNKEIHDDMYQCLAEEDQKALEGKLERLLDAMHLALRISKQYLFIVLAFIAAVIFILANGLVWWVALVSIVMCTIAFGYKTCEFIVNKYCFIDAHIVLIYKSVLDELLFYRKLRE